MAVVVEMTIHQTDQVILTEAQVVAEAAVQQPVIQQAQEILLQFLHLKVTMAVVQQVLTV